MHAVLTFSTLPLFLGALLSDWAYARSYQVQWTNFASWLIAGGLVLAGLALLWAAVDVLRSSATRHRRGVIYLLLLLASFVARLRQRAGPRPGRLGARCRAGWCCRRWCCCSLAVASVIGLAGLHRRTA